MRFQADTRTAIRADAAPDGDAKALQGPSPMHSDGKGLMLAMVTLRGGPLRALATLAILVLAGLLVFYHLTMLHDLVRGHGLSSDPTYNAIQGALRLSIIASLTGVVLGKRRALWAMWASIGGLIVTQYWAHFGHVPVDFTAGRHPLSYLKGLIFPTIITLSFFQRGERG